ncbi:MAG: hypothetical protein A2173_03425 [Planctomycetes bacterium RBG_13_44_8b]|nr:MAG: hypothetical protein A2173_03425 [Planctomycetes bacterium RBG_13_44_8b]
MSETIWGVIIGGAIGYITSITVIWIDNKRWRRQFEVDYLKTKRQQLENLCKKIVNMGPEAIVNKSWPIDFGTDLLVFLPHDLLKIITETIISEKDQEKRKKAFWELIIRTKKLISETDTRYERLVANTTIGEKLLVLNGWVCKRCIFPILKRRTGQKLKNESIV